MIFIKFELMEAIQNNKKLYLAKQKSIRLYESNLREFITTSHHFTPFIIFIPVCLYFIGETIYFISNGGLEKPLFIIPLALVAICIWTLMEYFIHRFIFHFETKSKSIEKMLYLIHWAHHDYPDDTKRLVVPPIVTIPAGFLLYGLSYLLLGRVYAAPFFSALLTAYLIYDWCHFASHHLNYKNKLFQMMKKHHLRHHFKDTDNAFGFTTDLWDRLFNTMVKKEN